MNWSLCLFCQKEKTTEKLRSVQSDHMSNEILDKANYDHKILLKLAGVIDLMAAEAKYHLSCYSAFQRSVERNERAGDKNDIPVIWLCKELRYSAEKGHVLQLDDVWERYLILCEHSGVNIPSIYASRRSSFKEHIESKMSFVIQFIKPVESSVFGRKICWSLVIFLHMQYLSLMKMICWQCLYTNQIKILSFY